MGEFEQYRRLVKQRNKELEQNRQKMAYNDLYKKVKISIETPIIGMIEEMENSLGYLWGHKAEQPTPEQLKFREEIWEPARKAILDKMNKAIQTATYHLGRFTFNYTEDDKKFHVHYSNNFNNKQ